MEVGWLVWERWRRRWMIREASKFGGEDRCMMGILGYFVCYSGGLGASKLLKRLWGEGRRKETRGSAAFDSLRRRFVYFDRERRR